MHVQLLLLVFSLVAPDAPDSITCTFPMRTEIYPGSLLVQATPTDTTYQESGTVTLEWAPQDTFRVNGLPFGPFRKYKRQYSEAHFQRSYGSVPFVLTRRAAGLQWRDAAAECQDSLSVLKRHWTEIWRDQLDRGVPQESIAQGITAAMSNHPFTVPSSVTFTIEPPNPRTGRGERLHVTYTRLGRSPVGLAIDRTPPPSVSPGFLSPADACALARTITRELQSARVASVFIQATGGVRTGNREHTLPAWQHEARLRKRSSR